MQKFRILAAIMLSLVNIVTSIIGISSVSAKKIKSSYKIEKQKSTDSYGQPTRFMEMEVNVNEILPDSLSGLPHEIAFAGYDKEVNSSLESFLVVNNSRFCVIGFTIRVDYLDMQGRMIHSREISERCYIPKGETRKIDVATWDKQHTYFYHLGNEPKRVATPYQVSFTPKTFLIENI